MDERLQGKPSPRYLPHRMSPNGLHEVITRPLDLAGIDEQHSARNSCYRAPRRRFPEIRRRPLRQAAWRALGRECPLPHRRPSLRQWCRRPANTSLIRCSSSSFAIALVPSVAARARAVDRVAVAAPDRLLALAAALATYVYVHHAPPYPRPGGRVHSRI